MFSPLVTEWVHVLDVSVEIELKLKYPGLKKIKYI